MGPGLDAPGPVPTFSPVCCREGNSPGRVGCVGVLQADASSSARRAASALDQPVARYFPLDRAWMGEKLADNLASASF